MFSCRGIAPARPGLNGLIEPCLPSPALKQLVAQTGLMRSGTTVFALGLDAGGVRLGPLGFAIWNP
jgi:hypothetical protein